MRLRGLMVALLSTCLLFGIFGCDHKKGQKPKLNKVSKEEKIITNDDEDAFIRIDEVITKYLKTIKEGKSSDDYQGKLKKVKNIFSTDVYNSLLPDVGDGGVKDENQEYDDEYVTTNMVDNIKIGIIPKSSYTADAIVLYDIIMSNKYTENQTTYCTELSLQLDDSAWVISKIENERFFQK